MSLLDYICSMDTKDNVAIKLLESLLATRLLEIESRETALRELRLEVETLEKAISIVMATDEGVGMQPPIPSNKDENISKTYLDKIIEIAKAKFEGKGFTTAGIVRHMDGWKESDDRKRKVKYVSQCLGDKANVKYFTCRDTLVKKDKVYDLNIEGAA
jgi:hypothetical protein